MHPTAALDRKAALGGVLCVTQAVSLNYFPVYENIHDPIIPGTSALGDTPHRAARGTVVPSLYGMPGMPHLSRGQAGR